MNQQSHEPTNRELLQHLHDHIRAMGKDQAAQAEQLHQIRLQQSAQGLLLRRIFRKVGKIMDTIETIEAQSEALLAKVTETRDAQEALKIYVQGIKDQVTQLAADLAAALAGGANPAALQKISANLTAAAEGIDAVEAGEAVMQNTPTPPAP